MSLESVHSFTASLNTAPDTELCIRTMRCTAPGLELTVGDCGSTDGSVEMLRRFERSGWLSLEVAPGGREHAAWLDHWVATSPARYALFVDSDVEFLRPGWLESMMSTMLAAGHALVCSEFLPGVDAWFDERFGITVDVAARPAPWLLLVDVEALRPLRTSFAFTTQPHPGGTGRDQWLDVGARVLQDVEAAGRTWAVMGGDFRSNYVHFGGRSWASRRQRPLASARTTLHIRRRLWRVRYGRLNQ